MDATNQNVTINWVLIYMYVRVKKYVPYSSNHQQKLNIDAQIIFLFFLFCDLLIVFMFFILFFYYCEKDTWSDKLIAELEKKIGGKNPYISRWQAIQLCSLAPCFLQWFFLSSKKLMQSRSET